MSRDNKEYQRAYYQANKERLKAKRKKQPRTEACLAAERRYREKMRIRREIAAMPVPTIDNPIPSIRIFHDRQPED